MKKIVALFAVLLTAFTLCLPAGAVFDSGTVTAKLKSDVYYMESLDEETAFFDRNSTKKVPAAAFVKILAAVTAIEKWPELDEKVTVSEKNLSLVEYGYGIRTALYKAGEKVSKRELIDCLIVYSANDAASIIAYEISGSLDAFIKEMQATADKIGLTSTVIKNIHGFDEDGQYTTARDIAKMLKYALNYPVFVEAFSASTVTLKKTSLNEERTYNASNKMLNATISDYYHSSVTGGKQTMTDKAGECIAVVSSKDGYSYLTVVLGGKLTDVDKDGVDENTCMTDAKKMLNWVYENIRYRVVASPTQHVAMVEIASGKGTDKLRLVPEKETSALVPANATTASVLFEVVEGTVPEKVKAPVKAGDIIGQANILYAGQILAKINLVAANDVSLSFTGLIMNTTRTIMTSWVFIILVALAAAGCIVYLLMSYNTYKKRERQKKAIQARIQRKQAQQKKMAEINKK
ncbi:MAG: D-alanyl-D-alanine carboxypeptidase [Ruminococcaceae bacterium]|nr:D-alanyl-D-alanine carboxypeptidase [Oscillospiraceae bacterium]MBQ9914339.1 D-alanyl-D-alanine carboxypeptidase [Clostridia bacterium]